MQGRYKINNLLPLGISPGPKAPRDLESFLEPFLEELKLLGDGVAAYDAHGDIGAFLLKAQLVLVTGDTPGISKLLHLNGHGAIYPCRACKIRGASYLLRYTTKKGKNKGKEGHTTRYYFPLSPPTKFPPDMSEARKEACSKIDTYASYHDFPFRSSEDYLHDGKASLVDPGLASESGVKGVSRFSELPTMSIPRSSPFDMMHLVYLNFVRDLCKLLNGTFFTDNHLNVHSARIDSREWEALGAEMAKIESPTSWGRPPRDIVKYVDGFKAEELSNFLTHYMLPLIYGRVSRMTYRALQRLVLVISIATSIEVEYRQMELMDRQLSLFAEWFYNTFYQNDHERLPACKYTVHCLLHLVRDIRNWGSASYYWQFPEVFFIRMYCVLIETGTFVW
jgi:hypothetical protein